jgi:hypothetical protein
MGLNKAFYEEQQPDITDEDVDYMMYLLDRSSYEGRNYEYLAYQIRTETDPEELERIKQSLHHNNAGIETINNPNQGDINKHLKRFI